MCICIHFCFLNQDNHQIAIQQTDTDAKDGTWYGKNAHRTLSSKKAGQKSTVHFTKQQNKTHKYP